jgi:hypothetical protein
MAQLDELTAHDVYAVFRLVGEVRELGADVRGWRAHAMRELRRLIPARVVMDAETRPVISGPHSFFEAASLGCEDRERDTHEELFFHPQPDLYDPSWPSLGQRSRVGAVNYTLLRPSFIPDREWRRSAYVRDVRHRFHIDEALYSSRAVPAWSCNHMLALHRPLGEPPFTERQRQLLALFHDELVRLWAGAGLIAPDGRPLPPALRATITALLDGDSAKQAAARLGLGEHTFADRLKRLYRLLGVHSRGELLSQVAPGLLAPRPRLRVERDPPATVEWYHFAS